MSQFKYNQGELFIEAYKATSLIEQYGTPLYVYSQAAFEEQFLAFDSAFKAVTHLTCYSVKANSNIHILSLLGKLGAGVDIVSGGELFRALEAGIAPSRIVYSGVGKKYQEIKDALSAQILLFNVESLAELFAINAVAAELNVIANVAFRINPDVDPKTHPYISTGMKNNKFGIAMENALDAYSEAIKLTNINPIGIDCHIGSQLTELAPFKEALEKIFAFYEKVVALGVDVQYIDFGGGLGIQYNQETPPKMHEFGEMVSKYFIDKNITLILEPGRSIAGNSGILLTEVVYTKETATKNFLIVDAAMNDLVRPSLYDSYHGLKEVVEHGRAETEYDIVGPICESGDFLAKERVLPQVLAKEHLVVFSAGAYGFCMSSNYNTRPRAAEILVSGENSRVIRRRETYEDLLALEK